MEFNFPKFETLRYGNDDDDIKENTFYKTKYNEKIKIVEHAKDFGIIMSSSGNFKQHIRTMVGAAQQLCGWILRTFSTRKKDPMLLLWRSKLEYCCQLWSPTQIGDMQSLE